LNQMYEIPGRTALNYILSRIYSISQSLIF
jgi:hypothetical protein